MGPFDWLRSVIGIEPANRFDGWAAPDTIPADRLTAFRNDASATVAGGASILNNMTSLGGPGDKGTAARPNPYVLPLSLFELRALYVYNGISRRIVDLIPQRACRRGWSVPDLEAEDQRLRVHERIFEGMVWSRTYGASLVVPITEDDVPPAFRSRPDLWLQEPLDLERVGAVRALHTFDGIEAKVMRWDLDPSSPTFRLPLLWRIGTVGFQQTIHASRVIFFRGNRRPPSESRGSWGTGNGFPDDSVLQVIWDQLRNLGDVLNAGAVMANELREAVLKLSGLSARMTGDDAANLQTQLQLMSQARGLLGYTLIGEGDDFQSRSNPPTGYDQLSAAAWEALAAVTGIPQVILCGTTPSGLSNSEESSHEGFRQLVSSYQEEKRYEIERLYSIVYAAQDGPTGGTAPDEWTLSFHSLDEPDEQSLAETRLVVAQTDQILISAGIVRASDVTASRYGASGYQFELDEVQPLGDDETGIGAALHERGGLAALPGLLSAGVLTPETAAELLGLPPPPEEDPAEEAALAAAAAAMAAPPTPDPATTDPKADAADDSVVILIPAADPGLRARVEAAIGQQLTVEDDPHVTVLYLGKALTPEAVAEVVAATSEAVEDLDPSTVLACPTLRAFPPGSDGTPIVLEYAEAWQVGRLNETLLRALAHVCTAKQWPQFRAHLTLGHASKPLTPEAQAALFSIDVAGPEGLDHRVPVSEVQVRQGDQVLLTAYPGARVPVNEPNMPTEAK
jgi:phage-related protein (TIGR01555 family)